MMVEGGAGMRGIYGFPPQRLQALDLGTKVLVLVHFLLLRGRLERISRRGLTIIGTSQVVTRKNMFLSRDMKGYYECRIKKCVTD